MIQRHKDFGIHSNIRLKQVVRKPASLKTPSRDLTYEYQHEIAHDVFKLIRS